MPTPLLVIYALQVTSGKGGILAKLDNIQVFAADIATCGETDMDLPGGAGTAVLTALSCPTKPGDNETVGFAMDVPASAPHGHYEVRVADGAPAVGTGRHLYIALGRPAPEPLQPRPYLLACM